MRPIGGGAAYVPFRGSHHCEIAPHKSEIDTIVEA
jgi:hypothetical protein